MSIFSQKQHKRLRTVPVFCPVPDFVLNLK